MTLPDKPFVLGQSQYYRLVSIPVRDGPRKFAFEASTTNHLREQVWVPCEGLEEHREFLSSVLHLLFELAHPDGPAPNS